MAFFGLTALGPQNSFAAAAKTSGNLHIFEEDDFQRAWERVNGKTQHCRVDKLPEIATALFRGPVPTNDRQRIDAAFDDQAPYFEMPGILSFAMYIRVMIELRDQAAKAEEEYDGRLKPTW